MMATFLTGLQTSMPLPHELGRVGSGTPRSIALLYARCRLHAAALHMRSNVRSPSHRQIRRLLRVDDVARWADRDSDSNAHTQASDQTTPQTDHQRQTGPSWVGEKLLWLWGSSDSGNSSSGEVGGRGTATGTATEDRRQEIGAVAREGGDGTSAVGGTSEELERLLGEVSSCEGRLEGLLDQQLTPPGSE